MPNAALLHVHPVLPSKNVANTVNFYVQRLGFSPAFQDSDPPSYAGLRRDQIELHAQWHDASEWERVERPMLRFVVSNVRALFEEFRSQDVFHAQTALRSTPWGTREFAFYDLDRNGLTFYEDL